mmetsp:Transcript_32054/g.98981  ORF Transcript_32054/g.98981 Transcript_32054/m.98981 type:complete len:161 (-) Transcript_32054:1337-1819(-)
MRGTHKFWHVALGCLAAAAVDAARDAPPQRTPGADAARFAAAAAAPRGRRASSASEKALAAAAAKFPALRVPVVMLHPHKAGGSSLCEFFRSFAPVSYRRPSRKLARWSWVCSMLQEDGTSNLTLQKSAETVLVRPRSGRRPQVQAELPLSPPGRSPQCL